MTTAEHPQSELQTERVRVMVVAEFPITRLGIRTAISCEPWLEVCADTGEAPQARQLCIDLQPELVVIDLELSTGDGLSLIREFTHLCVGTQILAFSEHDDDLWVQRSFLAGANGFVSKRDLISDLRKGFLRLSYGEKFLSRYVTESMQNQVVTGRRMSVPPNIESLTDKELSILRLLGAGQGARAIAQALHVAVTTVHTHLQRMRTKLALSSSQQLKYHASEWLASQTQRAPKKTRSAASRPGKSLSRSSSFIFIGYLLQESLGQMCQYAVESFAF